MAWHWCARMQYFCDLWMQQGGKDSDFTEADMAAFCKEEEWTSFVAGLPAGATRQRAEAIRAIRPLRGADRAARSSSGL